MFTGMLNRTLDANNKIACELADTLVRNGHTVVVCGLSDGEEMVEEEPGRAVRVYYRGHDPVTLAKEKLERFVAGKGGVRGKAVREFTLRHPLAAAAVFFSYTKLYRDDRVVGRAVRVIRNLHRKYDFDVAIAFCAPFWSVKSVMRAMLPGVTGIIIQLDPWGLHEMEIRVCSDPQKRIRQETALFKQADHILTTRPLLKQYEQNEAYRPFLGKMEWMDFPNIRKVWTAGKNPIDFDRNYTHILFAGMMDDRYRNPACFLQLAEKLIEQNVKIRVHFLGTNLSDRLFEYAGRYPENIVLHGSVPVDDAFAAMQACDFLLNISNTISNMVPSKIFDYFSLGKPMINVQKIADCPAAEYMRRYPLCFNIEEFNDRDCSEELRKFLQEKKGIRLNFEEIRALYETATPEYVAGQIEAALGHN